MNKQEILFNAGNTNSLYYNMEDTGNHTLITD